MRPSTGFTGCARHPERGLRAGSGQEFEEGKDLFFLQRASIAFGKGRHEGAGFAVADPLIPIGAVCWFVQCVEVGHHVGAVNGIVADAARRFVEWFPHFGECRFFVALGAASLENGLSIGKCAPLVEFALGQLRKLHIDGEQVGGTPGFDGDGFGQQPDPAGDVDIHRDLSRFTRLNLPGEIRKPGHGTPAGGFDGLDNHVPGHSVREVEYKDDIGLAPFRCNLFGGGIPGEQLRSAAAGACKKQERKEERCWECLAAKHHLDSESYSACDVRVTRKSRPTACGRVGGKTFEGSSTGAAPAPFRWSEAHCHSCKN